MYVNELFFGKPNEERSWGSLATTLSPKIFLKTNFHFLFNFNNFFINCLRFIYQY